MRTDHGLLGLLYSTHMAQDMVDRFLISHPLVWKHDKWRQLSYRASDTLLKLYNEIQKEIAAQEGEERIQPHIPMPRMSPPRLTPCGQNGWKPE